MASSSSLAFFLALVCFSAGGPLPLKNSVSEEQLPFAPLALWEEQHRPTALKDQVYSSIKDWSEEFIEDTKDFMRVRITDPLIEAYQKEYHSTDVDSEDEDLSFSASDAALVEEKPFRAFFLQQAEDPSNELLADVMNIRSSIENIVASVPKWTDTKGLLKVDLTTVDLNEGLFQVLLKNTKVPEYHQKNFQQIQNFVDSLISRAVAVGRSSAKSAKKTLRFLKTKYQNPESFIFSSTLHS